MNSLIPYLIAIDPWLIAPYRWLEPALAGYLLGTTLLALQCVIVGDLSALVVIAFNSRYLRKIQNEMDHHHDLSEKALRLGDKESYKAVNKQALDAFGHSFSLGAAIFCVSIWPMPFALAWLHMRFAEAPLELPFNLPMIGQVVPYFPSFLLIYIVVRILYSATLSRISWYSSLKARLTGLKPK